MAALYWWALTDVKTLSEEIDAMVGFLDAMKSKATTASARIICGEAFVNQQPQISALLLRCKSALERNERDGWTLLSKSVTVNSVKGIATKTEVWEMRNVVPDSARAGGEGK